MKKLPRSEQNELIENSKKKGGKKTFEKCRGKKGVGLIEATLFLEIFKTT
jgi:hypothetical protein